MLLIAKWAHLFLVKLLNDKFKPNTLKKKGDRVLPLKYYVSGGMQVF